MEAVSVQGARSEGFCGRCWKMDMGEAGGEKAAETKGGREYLREAGL